MANLSMIQSYYTVVSFINYTVVSFINYLKVESNSYIYLYTKGEYDFCLFFLQKLI